MVTEGTIVVRKSCRKMYTEKITSRTAAINEETTPLMEAWM